MKTTYKKTIVTIGTILLFLILFELALRITYPLYADYNTEMWRYSRELKEIRLDGGHAHIPNAKADLYGVTIQTNSLGLRSDKEYGKKNTTRILVLGDSFVLGWGVKQEKTLTYLLEQKLGNAEVINAGVGNYNTLLERKQLQRLTQLNPDIVLLEFYINDLETISYPNKFIQILGEHSYLYAFVLDKMINMKYMGQSNKGLDQHYHDLFRDANRVKEWKQEMRAIKNITKNINATLVVFYIPEMHQFSPSSFGKEKAIVKQFIITDLKTPFIDIYPYFVNITPQKLWVSDEDPHPNSNAQNIIAYVLSNEIKIYITEE